MMILLRTTHAYAKVDKVDPDEARRLKAQFLIYKVLEKSNCLTESSALARRVQKCKARIGVRPKKFRLGIRSIRLRIYRMVQKRLTNLKKVLYGKESPC